MSINVGIHLQAPVTNPKATQTDPWSTRYLGMVDYPAVIMWVLEQAEMAAAAFTAGTLTTSRDISSSLLFPVRFARTAKWILRLCN